MDEKLLALVALMLSDIDTITVSLEDDHDVDVWENKFALLLAAYLLSAYMLAKTNPELTDLEMSSLQGIVDEQLSYLAGFADEIRSEIKEGWNAAWEARASSYTNSLGTALELGKLAEMGDKPLTWRWDEQAEHCHDCEGLNGITRPASTWMSLGLYPKSVQLTCWQSCRCTLGV